MNDLLKLISRGENEGLELKESLRLKEEICQAVSAFSNAKGGSILVGVSNDGKVIGVDIGAKYPIGTGKLHQEKY
uniref:Schlafen AlbA-2 domain-containing protein n=1 Tax=Candidatus Methanophagaceae archaeon ANME-1 ERB6 TaxID=2759912 RepID=A0A7G9YV55_9EURY|nr:hypothetical protein HCMLNGLJ_00009 [Methanosarcinales archaeon ANME-1 ERB6]